MQFKNFSRRPLALLSASLLATPVLTVSAQTLSKPPAKPPARPATSAAPSTAPTTFVKGAAAADVNGEKVYKADVDRMVKMIQDKEESLRLNTPEAQKAVASLRESVTDNYIVQRLLVQEAKKRNISPNKEAVDKGVAAFKADYGSDEAFKKALAAEGKTPDDVRRIIAEELMIRELTKQLTSDITVADSDVQWYYNTHKEDFALPEMVRARHILVAYPENATAEQKKQLRAKADNLLKQAQTKNADFGKIARENSDDPGTKDAGGDLDFATRGTFVKSFEDAIFGAPVGVLPRLIETEYGIHIIKVEQKESARQLKFDEIKGDEQLRFTIRQGKIKKRIDEQIAAMRAKAKITKY